MSDKPTEPTKQAPSEIVARAFYAACGRDLSARADWPAVIADASIRALAEAGYKILPREPTEAMVWAGETRDDHSTNFTQGADCMEHWRAMWDAAE